jgi:outer membrane protein assembly factor BamB
MRTMSTLAVALLTLLAPGAALEAVSSDWLQWGGPNRNFVSDATGLASSWPAAGPKKLWARALGEGHSAIVAEGARLYTMYRPLGAQGRRGQDETVASIDAVSGKTVWEFTYPSSTAGLDFSEGAGPHSTPLIAGTRLFAASSRRELAALDKVTGKRLWSRDLIKEYGAPPADRGYSCSPLLYNGTIIMTVGGAADQSVMAFNEATGALVWKGGSFSWAPASPIVIDVDGQPQLVVFGGDRIAGMDPASGRLLWIHTHRTDWGLNISTPLWSADHLLFVSSAYGTGSRVLELRQAGGKTSVTEKWASPKMRVHISTVIRVGDYLYGSSGDFGATFLTAVDIRTGNVAWQQRAFARAQLLYADGKLIVLDEDGTLGLATVSSSGLKVLAKAQVLDNRAWTPPTLVGSTLYVRDRKTVAAFDLR